MRIGVVEDHDIVREGLVALLRSRGNVEVAWQARTGREALVLANRDLPDVVLMDVVLPDISGVEATRMLLKEHPTARVLALSARREQSLVAEMLNAGASGYLIKSNAVEELMQAIATLQEGGFYLGHGITHEVVRDYVRRLRQGQIPLDHELSPREREVLQLIAEGHSTKEIAARLHVSIQTIATHRRRLMEKTGAQSIAELTKYAIRSGLTPLES